MFKFVNKIKTTKIYLLLILILLIANLSMFFYFWLGPDTDNLAKQHENYALIDVNRLHSEQQHFISTLQPIREYLYDLVAKKGNDSISLYIEYLNTGANISINQDLRIFPASLVKVPLAMAVMKKVESGDWSLYNELVVMEGDRNYQWGDVHKYPIGTRLTIEKLLEEMLLNSDNTAFNILYRNLSFDELQDVIKALGLEDLFNEEGKITAKEYTRLFRSLYVASYLNLDHSQKLLKIMSQTQYDSYLGQGIPDDIVFSHKIGENDQEGVILDAGIVYVANRPYLISVAIDYKKTNMGREQALEILRDISSNVFKYINDYGQEQ